jgi:hypothetical protein
LVNCENYCPFIIYPTMPKVKYVLYGLQTKAGIFVVIMCNTKESC